MSSCAGGSPTSPSGETSSRTSPCARTWRWAPGASGETGRACGARSRTSPGAPPASCRGGQQRLLEIERALLCDPTLLLVDEPTVGLDPKTAAMIYRRLRQLTAEQGRTVLLVDQNIIAGTEIADHVYVIELGATKLEADKAEFDARYRATIDEWLI
jgi:branched-chain amino acid transport system ATP-binding protein